MTNPIDTPADPLHAKLQQKVLDLRTGKAFLSKQSLLGKIHGWWEQLVPQKTQQLIATSLPFLWLAGVLFTCAPLMSSQSLFPFGVGLVFVELGLCFLIVQLTNYTGGHKECTSRHLSHILQHDPSYEPISREIFSHLNHPHVLRSWWDDVDAILEDISNSIAPKHEATPFTQKLEDMLYHKPNNASNTVITIEPEHEQSKMNVADTPIAKHIKI